MFSITISPNRASIHIGPHHLDILDVSSSFVLPITSYNVQHHTSLQIVEVHAYISISNPHHLCFINVDLQMSVPLSISSKLLQYIFSLGCSSHLIRSQECRFHIKIQLGWANVRLHPTPNTGLDANHISEQNIS